MKLCVGCPAAVALLARREELKNTDYKKRPSFKFIAQREQSETETIFGDSSESVN